MTRLLCWLFGHPSFKYAPGIDLCRRCHGLHRDGTDRWVYPS